MKKLSCALVALLLLAVSGCSRPAAGQSSAPASSAAVSAPEAGQDAAGRFDLVYGGASFIVPDGFEQTEPADRPAAGYLYAFYDPALDMTIEVCEMPFAQLPADAATTLKTEYDAACADPGASRHESGDGWWAVSGLRNDGAEVWYVKRLCAGEDYYYGFTASYPAARRDACDGIVTQFESTFCR